MVAGAIDLKRGAVARELPRRLRIVPLYRVAVASFALIGYTLYTSHEKDTTAPK